MQSRIARKIVLHAVAFTLAVCGALPAWAAPAGGNVTAGAATITQSGATTTINQSSARAAINWQSFGIGANESVRFNQPSASSVALNRVLGQDPSAILGSLSANGQVFILNPNGILFGQGAQVNVGGLVASTLNLTNENFMAGRYAFERAGAAGSVVNQGAIRADGGVVAFIAPQVKNEGAITANAGAVALAAGEKVTLNLEGNRFLGLTVERGALEALAGNKGAIKADGGQVLLTAKAADALVKSVVNNEGTIEAQTLASVGGRIVLMAEGGETRVAGRLDASAPNGGDGGFVETSADKVSIAPGATITTAAPQGRTGTWLVDPTDFTIAASGGDIDGATLGTQLGSNNVTLATAATGAGNGDILVNDTVTWANANTLTLSAHRNVDFSAGGTLDGGATGNVTLNAGLNGASGAIVGHATNTVVAGNTLVVNALTGIGASATPLKTQVANAALTNTVGGGIYVSNGRDATGSGIPLTVAASSVNGDVVIRTADGVDSVTEAHRGGGLTVGTVGTLSGITTTTNGDVSLTAGKGGGSNAIGGANGVNVGGSINLDAPLISAGAITLRAGDGGGNALISGSGGSGANMGGSIILNAALTSGGTTTLTAGHGGGNTGIGTGGSLFNFGGSIILNAALTSGGITTLTAGHGGGNSGSGMGGSSDNSGGSITVGAAFTSAAAVTLAAGNGGGVSGNGGAVTLGNVAGSTALITGNGGSVAVSAGHAAVFGFGGSITLNSGVSSAGDITLRAGNGGRGSGGVSLAAAITASASGDAIRIAGSRFTNTLGASALGAPNGRWIVWSDSPANNTFGGLMSGNTAVWSTAYTAGSPTLAETGNRFVFSAAQPAGQAIVKADDKAKIFGDTFTGYTFGVFDAGGGSAYGNAFTDAAGTPTLVGSPVLASTGAAATATRTGGNAGGASYDITVDLTGVTAAGYTLQGVNGLLTVNARNVSVAADAKNLTYGDAPQALTYTATNLASFDTSAGVFTGTLARTAGATSGAGFERAGTTTIGQGTLAANVNYTLGFTGANYTIAPRALAVTATAQDKVYDGGTAATATLGDNRLAGDLFTASGSAAFADKNAAAGKTVTVSGIGLSGADAGNYAPNASTTAIANITQRSLDIGFTGVDKTYDASAAATVTAADNRVPGDTLTINRSATFVDANAAPAKPVTVSGVSLAGTDAANYSLGTFNTATSATIAPRPLTITALDAAKLTTDPMPALSASLAGFAPGEGPSSLAGLLALTTPATASSPVGSYAIVPSGVSGSNYAIAFVNGKLTVVSPNDPQLQGALASLFAAQAGTGASGAPAVSGTGGTFILGGGMISIVTGDSGDE